MARTRMSAQARRSHLVDAAVRMSQQEGGGAVTLAAVAAASGVSKPIAYTHFGTLSGLLQAALDRVEEDYETEVIGRMEQARADGAEVGELLEVLCATYVSTSLRYGAVHESITAALIAQGEAPRISSSFHARVIAAAAEFFSLSEHRAALLARSFLGAADALCGAVLVGDLERDAVVGHLVELFRAALPTETRS